MNSLAEKIFHHAEKTPHKPALYFEGNVISYQSLAELINACVEQLQSFGLKAGDTLAFTLFNSPDIIILFYACFHLRITIVPVDPRSLSNEVMVVLKNCRASALIRQDAGEAQAWLLAESQKSIKLYQKLQCYFLKISEALLKEDRAVVHYTSGSTGEPKGVVRTYGQLLTIMESYADIFKLTSEDCGLINLSMSHGFSFSMYILPAMYVGASLVIHQNFSEEKIVQDFICCGVTRWCALTTQCLALVNHFDESQKVVDQAKLKLQECYVGGDVVHYALQEKFQAIFGIFPRNLFGMTEAFACSVNYSTDKKKSGSIGLPMPKIKMDIRNGDGSSAKAGEEGEIVIAGYSVMKEYLYNPKATAEAIKEGWLYSGDVGYKDEDGYFWFTGRSKQMFKANGYVVSPQEVERVLEQHPSVAEAAVFSVPDKARVHVVGALVKLKKPLTEEELKSYSKEKLSSYKIPEHILFVDALPKNALGKIDRKNLLKVYEAKA